VLREIPNTRAIALIGIPSDAMKERGLRSP
jgi:hypothetical protein